MWLRVPGSIGLSFVYAIGESLGTFRYVHGIFEETNAPAMEAAAALGAAVDLGTAADSGAAEDSGGVDFSSFHMWRRNQS